MARKEVGAEKLGEILEKSLKRLELSGRLLEYGVWPIWNETVGPTIARNAQPEKIRKGTLFVRVTSPAWMQQLQYMKEIIREKLNESLKGEVVKNLFFFVGEIDTETSPFQREEPPASRPPLSESKPDEERLSSIKDPEIRRALIRLFTAHSRRRK